MTMRELHCAHLLTAADAPAGGPHIIQIDNDRICAAIKNLYPVNRVVRRCK